MQLVAALFVGLLAVSQAFVPAARGYRSGTALSAAFGVQKLGEKIIGTPTITTPVETEAPGVLKRSAVGSGRDERFSSSDLELELATSRTQLVNIDKSFRQQALLMTLAPDSILGFVDKAERVRLATTEGLLPMSLNAESVSSSSVSLKSGGLFKDWDFDM